MRGGHGRVRPRELLTRVRFYRSARTVFDRCNNPYNLLTAKLGARDPARSGVRALRAEGCECCLIRQALFAAFKRLMEWPMLMRRHLNLVSVFRAFVRRVLVIEENPDPERLFLLLWRLKPFHPPSPS